MMENSFLKLFRRKKKNEVSQLQENVETNVLIENTEAEPILDEKDLLLQKIKKEDLDILEIRFHLKKEDITLYFANLLIDNPFLLSYLKEHYLDDGIVHKMNQNKLRITDIPSYDKEFFKFPIFSEEDQSILKILNHDIVLSDNSYISLKFSDYEKQMDSKDFIDSVIPSFFEKEEILLERKRAIPLVYNNIYNDSTQVITPLDNEKIFQQNIFDMYYSGDLTFQKETVIMISYDEFLKWIQSEEKRKILENCQVVLKENPNTFEFLNSIPWIYQQYSYASNSIENNQLNKLQIQGNHLLYIICHSKLGTDANEYYQYQIANHLIEAKDYWQIYLAEDKLRTLALEIQKKVKKDKIHKQPSFFLGCI